MPGLDDEGGGALLIPGVDITCLQVITPAKSGIFSPGSGLCPPIAVGVNVNQISIVAWFDWGKPRKGVCSLEKGNSWPPAGRGEQLCSATLPKEIPRVRPAGRLATCRVWCLVLCALCLVLYEHVLAKNPPDVQRPSRMMMIGLACLDYESTTTACASTKNNPPPPAAAPSCGTCQLLDTNALTRPSAHQAANHQWLGGPEQAGQERARVLDAVEQRKSAVADDEKRRVMRVRRPKIDAAAATAAAAAR